MRERAEWGRINPSADSYSYDYTNGYMDIVKNKGINISSVFHGCPSWAKEDNSSITHDLFNVYKFMYHAADGIHADAWEFWNEQDAVTFMKEPADVYSAAFKAASIAIADASNDIKKVLGGFTYIPGYTRFSEQMLKNDVLRYADAYNFHEYAGDDGSAIQDTNFTAINAHLAIKNKYDKYNRAVWITEGGMPLWLVDGMTELTEAQQQKQATYIVTSTVQAVASGVDKHFWFILPSYTERSREFGIFTPDNQPYPAYCALSVMTNALGSGIIKGSLDSDSIEGYIFDNGKNDTYVLYAKEEQQLTLSTDNTVTKTDLMGRSTQLSPENGVITVTVGDEPLYLTGSFQDEDYNVISKAAPTDVEDFSDSEKIVVVPRLEYENYIAVKKSGYKMQPDSENTMPVEIYNFSDKEMSGSLTGTLEGNVGSVVFDEETVTVPSMGKVTVNASITAADVKYDTEYNLTIGGTFGGGEISNCVADVYFDLPADTPVTYFTALYNDPLTTTSAGSWGCNLKGAIAGGTATANSDGNGGVEFAVNFTTADKDNWFYPPFYIKNDQTVKNSSGMSFTLTSDVDRDDVSINAFLYQNDGGKVFLGTNPYYIKKGDNRFFIRWDKFEQHTNSTASFDLNKVNMICVGISTKSAGEVKYTLTNVGTYSTE